MQIELASRQVLDGADATEYSQPVAMAGANNQPWVDCVVFHFEGTGSPNLAISVEESNDLENWDDAFGGTPAIGTIGSEGYYEASHSEKVQGAYIRLKYKLTGTAPKVIFAANVNLSHQ